MQCSAQKKPSSISTFIAPAGRLARKASSWSSSVADSGSVRVESVWMGAFMGRERITRRQDLRRAVGAGVGGVSGRPQASDLC